MSLRAALLAFAFLFCVVAASGADDADVVPLESSPIPSWQPYVAPSSSLPLSAHRCNLPACLVDVDAHITTSRSLHKLISAVMSGSKVSDQPLTCLNAQGDKGTLLQSVNAAVDSVWKKYEGKAPKFSKVGVPDFMKCNIASSIVQIQFAPQSPDGYPPSPQSNYAYGYFNQTDRSSCSLATAAAWFSTKAPENFATLLSELYWTGESTMGGITFKPRDYIYDLNPLDDANCVTPTSCQVGAQWMWSFVVRDVLNQKLLSESKAAGVSGAEYDTLVKNSYVAIQPSGEKSQTGTQEGDGSSFFAVPNDVVDIHNAISKSKLTLIQGACGADTTCSGVLNGLLPKELVHMKQWYGAAAQAKATGQPMPPYVGFNGVMFEGIKKRTEEPNLFENIMKMFTPVSGAQIMAMSKAGGGGVSLDSIVLQGDGSQCPDGQTVGCTPQGKGGCPVLGQAPCVMDHFIYLVGCDANELCTVWTWGVTMKIMATNLAKSTTALIYQA